MEYIFSVIVRTQESYLQSLIILGGNFASLGIGMLGGAVLHEVRQNTEVRNHGSNRINPD